MKSMHRSIFLLLKTTPLILLLSLYFCCQTIAQAGDRSALSPGSVTVGHSDYRAEVPQGYLKVYSATDQFDDGGLLYYAHSSYAIYTIDGNLFKSVENHISRGDEIPELVSLPVGSYIVIARSENAGYVRIPVIIKEGQQTILDLDLGQRRLFSDYGTTNWCNSSLPNVNRNSGRTLRAV
jgi:hypothetical protein